MTRSRELWAVGPEFPGKTYIHPPAASPFHPACAHPPCSPLTGGRGRRPVVVRPRRHGRRLVAPSLSWPPAGTRSVVAALLRERTLAALRRRGVRLIDVDRGVLQLYASCRGSGYVGARSPAIGWPR
eukprot:6292629-Prymnesium_polylepis.1